MMIKMKKNNYDDEQERLVVTSYPNTKCEGRSCKTFKHFATTSTSKTL